jgi:hypothetical protein
MIIIFLNFFSLLFDLSLNSRVHTCGSFASHQCEAAHRLEIADLEYTESNCMITDEW